MHLIDRRHNPKGKSLVNSERFKDRARDQIKASVDHIAKKGKVENMGGNSADGSTITIKTDRISEPSFHFDHRTGSSPRVLPGNPREDEPTSYVEGDLIPRPSGGSGGRGRGGSPDGEGIDEFTFSVSQEEYLKYLFEDLELPNMEDKETSETETVEWTKAGFKSTGSPSTLALQKTIKNSLGRRIALKRPKFEDMEELQNQLDDPDLSDDERKVILDKIAAMQDKMYGIPYIDPFDVRYHNYTPQPKPMTNAVMFCVMDVSGSMGETEKDLAKRFYILLYRFLKTKYEKVDVVFIRHTSEGEICDEETFFFDQKSGGTLVSSGLEKVAESIQNTYSPDQWNIYIAQASDGDNYVSDNPKTKEIIEEQLLPVVKYFSYIQIDSYESSFGNGSYDLWPIYKEIQQANPNKFAIRKVRTRVDIYPAFYDLFKRKT